MLGLKEFLHWVPGESSLGFLHAESSAEVARVGVLAFEHLIVILLFLLDCFMYSFLVQISLSEGSYQCAWFIMKVSLQNRFFPKGFLIGSWSVNDPRVLDIMDNIISSD